MAAVLLTVLFGASALGAGIPKHLSHQGVLTDMNGVVVPDGLYTLAFDIYDAASNGNQLFGQQLQVDVVGGVYNVLLSDNPGSPGTLEQAFENPTTYLQLTIVDVPPASGITPGQVLTPRQKLASVPYAFVAAKNAQPPALELVDEHEANDDPEVVLSLPAEFQRFEIHLTDVLPTSVTPVDLIAHVSTDGGNSFDASAGDYAWNQLLNSVNSGGTNGAGLNSDSRCGLTYQSDYHRLSNDVTRSFSGTVEIQNAGGQGYFQYVGGRVYLDSTGIIYAIRLRCLRLSPLRVDAIRFRVSAGNIQSGSFKLYGLR